MKRLATGWTLKKIDFQFTLIDDEGYHLGGAAIQTIKALEQKGFIEGSHKNKNGVPSFYEITDEGKEFAEFAGLLNDAQ